MTEATSSAPEPDLGGVKGANTTAHSIDPSTSIAPLERILGWLGGSTSHDSEV